MVIHLPHDHGGFGIEGGVWRPKRLSVTALAGIYFFFKHRGSAATWRREVHTLGLARFYAEVIVDSAVAL